MKGFGKWITAAVFAIVMAFVMYHFATSIKQSMETKNGNVISMGVPHWRFHATATCEDVDQCGENFGKVMWVRDATNMVTRAGCQALITQTFKTQTAPSWYVGEIKAYTSFSTQDTMASHTNWTSEATTNTDITNANRPALTLGAVSIAADAVSADNSASPAVFTQNSTITLKGFYVTDENTVGGATGTLYGEATFTDAPVAAGYQVTVTATLTATAG